MKSFEKLQQLQQNRHFSDKEIYLGIGLKQGTYNGKKHGRTDFKPAELRSIEKLLHLNNLYLDEDPLPLPTIKHTPADMTHIIIDVQHKYIDLNHNVNDQFKTYDQRIARLEAALLAQQEGKGKRREISK